MENYEKTEKPEDETTLTPDYAASALAGASFVGQASKHQHTNTSNMKKSTINFTVELDSNNIPEKIFWDASEKPEPGASETKSISIAVWDHGHKNTLRIDLWSKDMPVDEMKRFYVDCIGGIAQSMLSSTGDELMASKTNALCEKLVEHLKKEGNH